MDRARSTAKAPQSRRAAAKTERTRPASSLPSPVDRIHFLQRTVGNQALGTRLAQHLPALPPRIQRQAHKRVELRIDRIKAHVKAGFPELHALIANNPLNGKYVPAHTETIEGKAHTWEIAVTFASIGLTSGGRTGPAESPKGRPHIHRIDVPVNTFVEDKPELAERFPNLRERIEFLRAETLAHELIHAAILIQQQGAVKTASGSVLVGYRKVSDVAASTATRDERFQVWKYISSILIDLELFETDEAVRDRYIDRQIDELVEEKYANQASRTGFGRSIDNERIANLYVGSLVRELKGKSTVKDLEHLVNRTEANLEEATKRYFDKIDSALAAASPQPTPQERPRTEPRRRVFGPEP